MEKTFDSVLMLAVAMAVAGCGAGEPLSVEEAMVECEGAARQATRPTASVTVGVNSEGAVSSGFIIGVTDDFLAGRDPEDVYRDCVVRRSGKEPSRPFEE